MDKYEYKIRAEEIKTLISQKKYAEAAKVADTIDWSRVKSVMMLCTVSDVYKVNRRFDDAKLLLEMANERHPAGRMIIYSLCDLSIRMDDVVQALKYFNEFVRIAPNDSGRYVLQYRLYEAQDTSLEERIAVLEELKKKEYREKWAYELAYLYHRVGLATKCVEECDDLILWFGEGKYVMKAMELKTLHQPLSPSQQQKFDVYMMRKQGLNVPESMLAPEPDTVGESGQSAPGTVAAGAAQDMDIQVKTMDVGKYNTINLQKELAESMREFMQPGQPVPAPVSLQNYREQMYREPENTYPEMDTTDMVLQEYDNYVQQEEMQQAQKVQPVSEEAVTQPAMQEYEAHTGHEASQSYTEQSVQPVYEAPQSYEAQPAQATYQNPHTEAAYDNYLSQEYDGQISMVVPETRQVEKQITGQMNIEDIMREWERMKQENEEKRRQELRQRVMEQTGSLFRDFDETSRSGMLEQLQKEERIPVERRNNRASEASPASAQTKIWAAGEVEKALTAGDRTVPPAPVSVPVPQAEYRPAPDAGMAELSAAPSYTQGSVPQAVPAAAAQPAVAAAAVPTAAAQPAVAAAVPTAPVEMQVSQPEPVRYAEPETARYEEAEPLQQRYAEPEPVRCEEPEPQRYAEPEPEFRRYEGEEPERYEEPENPRYEDGEPGQSGNVRQTEEPHSSEHVRNLSAEEKRLFASFVPTKGAMRKLVCALDKLSLAAYTGNLVLTGDPGADTLDLAKSIIRDMKAKDHNFSGKLAKVTGSSLNSTKKDPAELVEKLAGGALVIDEAGDMAPESMDRMLAALNQERWGILVILMDTRRNIKALLEENPEMASYFNARFDIEALDNGTLAAYGCQYAKTQEYSIDELGRLALHTRIEDMQTSDHIVTVKDVREIVDEAIDHANRKTPKHFMDVLFARRYDDDDMIILHEGDFI